MFQPCVISKGERKNIETRLSGGKVNRGIAKARGSPKSALKTLRTGGEEGGGKGFWQVAAETKKEGHAAGRAR